MQLIDMIEVERNLTDLPRGLDFAQSQKTHPEITQRQSQDAEQTQNQCEENSRCQDTLSQMQIEALKDVKSVDEALSLLEDLRGSSQISDSAHESLSKAFMLFSKDKKKPVNHLGKMDDTQSPSVRRDADMLDETVLAAAGIKVPKRQSASRPFKDPSSKRKQLTSEEAAEIYSMRPKVAKGTYFRRGCMVKSKMIAPHFGVTPKTVRDIWQARTWVSATRHLWTEEDIALRTRGAEFPDEGDKNDSPGSASPTFSMENTNPLQNLSQDMAGQVTSLPSIPPLRNQFMMGGFPSPHVQLPFGSSASSALAHHFSQQAAMSGLLFNGLAQQQHQMGFSGYHPSVGMGVHSLILPEASPPPVSP